MNHSTILVAYIHPATRNVTVPLDFEYTGKSDFKLLVYEDNEGQPVMVASVDSPSTYNTNI